MLTALARVRIALRKSPSSASPMAISYFSVSGQYNCFYNYCKCIK
jgi:hypothetical protein